MTGEPAWYEHSPSDPTPITRRPVPLRRLFAAIVALETLYLLQNSLAVLARFEANYPLWPVTVVSSVLWPLTFGWSAYVLWRPKLAESRAEALLRSIPVWLVFMLNLLFLAALVDRPEMVLRNLF